jgi:hypothetical protein
MAATSIKQVIESGDLKRYIDPRVIKALGHPIREHALAVFNERIASATEIGEEIALDVSLFYSHIEVLEKLGCIERVDTKRRRGAKEHFFKARATLFFDDEHCQRTPRSVRDDVTLNILRAAFGEAVEAANAGTLNACSNEHVSWTPGQFDQQAWDEAAQLLEETLTRMVAILDKSAERLAECKEDGIPATVAILGFKTGAPNLATA